MLKAFIITLLVIFVLIKIGSFFFRTMVWMLGARNGQRQPSTRSGKQSAGKKEGDIEIDYIPEQEQKKRQKGFRGGEYVDYEELK